MSGHREEARRLIGEGLGIGPQSVPDDAAIGTLEAWDSLGHMRIILALEAALGRELSPEAVAAVGSLGDIAQTLAEG